MSNFENVHTIRDLLNHIVAEQFADEPYSRKKSNYKAPAESESWRPAVEIWETDKSIFFSLDLPGVSSEELDVQMEGDQLVIRGERKPSEEKRNYLRREKVYGKYYRAFEVPIPIDREKISASYKNGVLEVALPKSEDLKPRQIKIEVEG